MITDSSYWELKRLTDRHVCGECGGSLSVVWAGIGYALRCGKNNSHNAVTLHYREWYKWLWNKINRDYQWESNPFVWVYTFKPLDKLP